MNMRILEEARGKTLLSILSSLNKLGGRNIVADATSTIAAFCKDTLWFVCDNKVYISNNAFNLQ